MGDTLLPMVRTSIQESETRSMAGRNSKERREGHAQCNVSRNRSKKGGLYFNEMWLRVAYVASYIGKR
jgi:hypothetical protein